MSSPTALPVKRCTMPESGKVGICGQVMQARRVPPAAPGAVAVTTYRCLVCDVRRCAKCKHLVQSLDAHRCPGCGSDLWRPSK